MKSIIFAVSLVFTLLAAQTAYALPPCHFLEINPQGYEVCLNSNFQALGVPNCFGAAVNPYGYEACVNSNLQQLRRSTCYGVDYNPQGFEYCVNTELGLFWPR